ncbi:retron St85 family RNA-directed DNA polymerase [Proteus columbae]|uniref:retron St85 family RNA-directed DNA polymerase n=1 Tax=Proteus columbae TaxID=1987580 RepID=UPI0034D74278
MFVEALAQNMGISTKEVMEFLANAPEKYKVYKIPKRSTGYRTIAQPSKELKAYQRQISNVLSLPIHDAAMAYREGISIKNNALKHANNSYLLNMDFENFFNSITPDVFWSVWEKGGHLLSDIDKYFIERLLFWSFNGSLVLSVGAPSSPLISNFCLFYFDSELNDYCIEKKITYTRYADDLTFSTNIKGALFEIPLIVKDILYKNFSDGLKINRSKTILSSKAHNRHVTGITLNNNGQISLGRAKKRYIKHKVHQYTLGLLGSEEINHLQGMIVFARYIEPSFFKSLKAKYSKTLVDKLLGERYE